MGDDDDRPALGDLLHVTLDHPLALVIERAGGLIEDQDARIHCQCASDGNALSLSARKARATFADDGVVALRHLQDEVVCAGELRRRDHPVHWHRRIGERDILADRAVEQHVLL